MDAECSIFRGMDAVLKLQPQLADLAQRFGQWGSADHLAYFMSARGSARKTPYVVLFRDVSDGPGANGGGGLAAAVVLFEYDLLVRSRVFSTFDWTGRRNVFAPAGRRAEFAAKAARSLLNNGAQIVHISVCEHFSDEHHPALPHTTAEHVHADASHSSSRQGGPGQARWTSLTRNVPLYLRIHPTFDATLAEIHKKTRANLRYYRRRSETDLGCRFVSDAHLTLADFVALNQQCAFAVSAEYARSRYELLQRTPGHFLRGVVDKEGRWLSVVGGRKYGRAAEIDWQMNRADLPGYSLSTVMRSYVLEHEGLLGSTALFIEGGTPSPLRQSFIHGAVEDFVTKRTSPRNLSLETLYRRILPEKNYLGRILRNPELKWKKW